MKLYLSIIALAIATFMMAACGGGADEATEIEEAPTEDAVAEEAPAEEAYLDATEVAPDNYKLLSAEGNVRIVEMTVGVGQKDNKHSHNEEYAYFVSGGKARIYIGDQSQEAELPDGATMSNEPWTHQVENIGDKDIHAIICELMETPNVNQAEAYIDATEAASDNYKLLHDGDKVRIIEMTLEPGMQDAEHSHNMEHVYFITGGSVKIHVGDEVVDAEIPDGHVMHHDAWKHSVENVGETTIRAIIFEEKPTPVI
jgi:mannose-6-phosphate isomerase-like protein (cupin superfamily)